MSKELSPEKLAKKKAKEAKELQKWERVKAKPLPAHYFGILIVVITIIYIVDEITSNINSAMQSSIIFDFFNITSRDVNDPAYKSAINTMAITGVFSLVFLFAAPFYKSLSDIYGRRLFLMINTCVFGVGMFIIMIAPHFLVYIIGVIVLSFVTPNDVQVLYIMEVAPKEKRATLCFITKGIALVSVSLIGVLRTVFMPEGSDLSAWRMVYLIPVIVAIAVGLMSIFFTRETPVFIDERLKYLRMTDEERKAKEEEAKKNKTAQKGGVVNAIKFIFAHKQTRFAAIAALLFSAATVYTSYYETIMASGMSVDEVSKAIIVFPFFNGATTVLAGFISDKLGRKKSCLVFGSFTAVMLALFIISSELDWGYFAAGAFYGMSIGGLWSMSDTLFLTIPAESSPSELRASVMAVMSLMLVAGALIGMVLIVVGQNYVNMGWLCLAVCCLFMVIALFILLTKVHETKDVDLETVTGTEWD